ncbi:MAG: 3-methyl-2-oxobutanoate dehydrogenase subunit VorB [Chloroflexi bacterium]|nr:3-methyl-2-oxobutanoate dehydrogenase subunit VorB [Chloroflexota bacterium]
MKEKLLMKGNEAIGEGAIRAGCQAYFGYPITPQTELLEYMSHRMPELGRIFIQAESEIAAINMCYGAAAAGARVMTSSSSPGISLKQEGISYMAGAELPCVVVNVVRGGPGLGNVAPAQGDYFQATRGGGHGDYRTIVLAPASVQEAMDLTSLAFDLADRYRNPVMVLADGLIGQTMEAVELHHWKPKLVEKPWALTGAQRRAKNVVKSICLQPEVMEQHVQRLQEKYARMRDEEVRYAEYLLDDAEVVLVAYGTSSRVCRSAVKLARAEGIAVGLFRPISLFPFPYEQLGSVAQKANLLISVELSAGQMIEDVRLAANGVAPVELISRLGGMVFSPEEVAEAVARLAGNSGRH